MLFVATLLTFLLLSHEVASYCLCNVPYVVVINTVDCFNGTAAGVQNICVNCPTTLPNGHIENRCFSLVREGYGLCSQPGAFNASQQVCLGLGGNIGSTEFKCMESSGTDTSQTTNCVTSSPSLFVPTTAADTPTGAPTSGVMGGVVVPVIMVVVPFIVILYII
jgi:hypothetical protein